jgi:hypothetical protein
VADAAGIPESDVDVDSFEGPAALTVLRARLTRGYPGAHAATALADGQHDPFGRHTETPTGTGFGLRGWFTQPPDPRTVAMLVSYADFDGLLSFLDHPAPALVARPDALLLSLHVVRAGKPTPATVLLRNGESATLTFEAPVPAAITSTGLSRSALLRDALRRRDAMTIGGALRAFNGPLGSDDVAALADAVVQCGPTNARVAADRLGASMEAVNALAAALAPLSATARASILDRLESDGSPALSRAVAAQFS